MKRAAALLFFLVIEACLMRDAGATTWTGPDLLGYSGASVPYSFSDISASGAPLSLADDEVSGPVQIGFTFNFYGIEYTSAYVSSNGFITFSPGQNNGCCEGQNIPEAAGPNNLIAGYWTDLAPQNGGTIHYWTTGQSGQRNFVVQFMNVPLIGASATATFQIILHEGTNAIEMQFADVASNGQQVYVTGIENSGGTAGLQYNYGDYSISNLGIMISPPLLTIHTQPVGQNVCSGSIVTFTSGAAGTPSPSIQWQVSTDGGGAWSDIPGAKSANLTFTATSAENGFRYRAVFTSGSRAVSDPAILDVTTITVNPSTVPGGAAGAVYPPTQFSSAGGVGSATYAVTGGLLPAGMGLTLAGLLSGVPTQTGSFPVSVTATDSGGCTGSRDVIVSIGCTTITVAPSNIPTGLVGVTYPATQFSSSGGVGSVAFSVMSGSLPGGMTLTSAGLLSGTPAQSGSFPITIAATDANGCMGVVSFTLSVGLNNTVSVLAANGTGQITLATSSPGCWFSNVRTFTEAETGDDPGFAYPYGLVGFNVNCSQADVTITFPGDISGSTYRKYGPTVPGIVGTTAWYSFPAIMTGTSVTLHFIDGQAGDDTGQEGIIADQGGPAAAVAGGVVAVPAVSGWGMILFMLISGIAAGHYLRRRRKQQGSLRSHSEH